MDKQRFKVREYPVTILRIVDGDTVEVEVDQGFGSSRKETARVAGIDCPETKTRSPREKRHGLAAARRVAELLPPGSEQAMTSLRFNRNGLYGRVLANFDVSRATGVKGDTLSACLLRERHAVAYSGGRRRTERNRALHAANWDWRELKARMAGEGR